MTDQKQTKKPAASKRTAKKPAQEKDVQSTTAVADIEGGYLGVYGGRKNRE